MPKVCLPRSLGRVLLPKRITPLAISYGDENEKKNGSGSVPEPTVLEPEPEAGMVVSYSPPASPDYCPSSPTMEEDNENLMFHGCLFQWVRLSLEARGPSAAARIG